MMAFGNPNSGWWFHGRLSPAMLVPRADVQEIEVRPHVKLEVIGEGIAVWSKPPAQPPAGRDEAAVLFSLVVAAYALTSGRALDSSLEGWVEATEADLADSVVGFRLERELSERPSRLSIDTDRMREAAELAVAVSNVPLWRLTLRDLHASRRAGAGDDAFLFAYRAIESAARQLSGQAGELRRQDWRAFHERRGAEADAGHHQLKVLKDARDAAAHGREGELLDTARLKRGAILDLAREVTVRALLSEDDLAITSIRLSNSVAGSLPKTAPASDPSGGTA